MVSTSNIVIRWVVKREIQGIPTSSSDCSQLLTIGASCHVKTIRQAWHSLSFWRTTCAFLALLAVIWGMHVRQVNRHNLVTDANESLMQEYGEVSQALLLMNTKSYNDGRSSVAAEDTRTSVKYDLASAQAQWWASLPLFEAAGINGTQAAYIGDILRQMAMIYTPPTSASMSIPPSTLRATIQWLTRFRDTLSQGWPNHFVSSLTPVHEHELLALYETFGATPLIGDNWALPFDFPKP